MVNRAFYDEYDYRIFWRSRPYEQAADQLALRKLLGETNGKRDIIVDIGGGFGRNIPLYRHLWKQAILLDPSHDNLKEASEKYGQDNVRFVFGKAEHLPFKNSSVETILCVRVFHHLPDLSPVIKEMARVLKPGGEIIIEFANKMNAKAVFRALVKGEFGQFRHRVPIDRRSPTMKRKHTIPFVNHHPQYITKTLLDNHFEIEHVLSVSNFRWGIFERYIPLVILYTAEWLTQDILAPIYFGPSIYIRAKKT